MVKRRDWGLYLGAAGYIVAALMLLSWLLGCGAPPCVMPPAGKGGGCASDAGR